MKDSPLTGRGLQQKIHEGPGYLVRRGRLRLKGNWFHDQKNALPPVRGDPAVHRIRRVRREGKERAHRPGG